MKTTNERMAKLENNAGRAGVQVKIIFYSKKGGVNFEIFQQASSAFEFDSTAPEATQLNQLYVREQFDYYNYDLQFLLTT